MSVEVPVDDFELLLHVAVDAVGLLGLFENLCHPERALKAFWTQFDLFRNGEPPAALTPTAKHMLRTNPDMPHMSEDERKAWAEKLNRIFYTE